MAHTFDIERLTFPKIFLLYKDFPTEHEGLQKHQKSGVLHKIRYPRTVSVRI